MLLLIGIERQSRAQRSEPRGLKSTHVLGGGLPAARAIRALVTLGVGKLEPAMVTAAVAATTAFNIGHSQTTSALFVENE